MSRSIPSRTRARVSMVLPVTRVLLRRIRSSRGAVRGPLGPKGDRIAQGLPHGRPTVFVVAGRPAGVVDIRHDQGSSTLEVWTELDGPDAARQVAAHLRDAARECGAHRIAWSLRPGSVEHAAAVAAGLVREGAVTPPLRRAGTPHELWAAVGPW